MKRFLRILLYGLTVLSLLFFLATAVLWIRAGGLGDAMNCHSGRTLHVLQASPIGITYDGIWTDREEVVHKSFAIPWLTEWHYVRWPVGSSGSGFVFDHGVDGDRIRIGLPHWFICLVTALAPAAWLTSRFPPKASSTRPLSQLPLRPPRHARSMPRMWDGITTG